MNNYTVASPLEQFEVWPIIGIHAPILLGSLSLTNLGFYVILVLITFISINLAGLYSKSFSPNVAAHSNTTENHQKMESFEGIRIVPSMWGIGAESAYTSMQSQTKEQIGSRQEIYLPFLYSLFFFILFGNLFGNVPYSFTITSSVVVAIGFSVIIFIGVTILAVAKHGLHFLSFFVPAGTPGPLVPLLICIEIISYVARAFSLGVRLFANIVAGHALLNILSGMLYKIITLGLLAAGLSLLPLAIFLALVGLELAVSVIQAYVFVVLTSSYLKDAIYLH